MPAFWVKPKRSPEGQSVSISSVKGSDPAGPSALVVTSYMEGSEESRIALSCWLDFDSDVCHGG